MNGLKKRLVCVISICVAMALAEAALAEDFPVIVGRGVAYPASIVPSATSGDRLSFQVGAARSYCCEVYTAKNRVDAPRFERVLLSSGVDMGGDPIQIWPSGLSSEPYLPDAGNLADLKGNYGRVCFFSEINIGGTAYLEMIFGPDGTSSATNITATCEDTTLFGGYNTSVTNYNFLEIRNIIQSNQSVTLVLRSSVGGGSKTIGPIDVEQQFRKDIDIHSLVGPGQFGLITLLSTGPRGSIQARLSQYNIVNGNPLNFVPVGSEVFTGLPQ